MDINGLLLVDKPLDMTSHDVVNILRRRFKIKKIGHAGTLDPQATGLLIMLIGKQATKKAGQYSGMDKTYLARLTLGKKTDTADHTGIVIEKSSIPELDKNILEKTFSKFKGNILQVPPMVSAKKVKGQKLYVLARKGIIIKRDPVEVKIKELKILKINLPDIDFQVTCSKGTYVRTLCEDIGMAVGSLAYMNGLRRTRIGDFDVKNAISVDRIKQEGPEDVIKAIKKI
jgi:tRNA pseudouridine55 synthase